MTAVKIYFWGFIHKLSAKHSGPIILGCDFLRHLSKKLPIPLVLRAIFAQMMLSFGVMDGARAELQGFESGFTLIELLVTLAVVAVMLAMTVPGFQTMITGNALASFSNEFVAALHLARSEAIKRGTRTTLCKSATSTAATPSCGGSGWHDGWLIFVDSSVPLGQFSVSEEIIQRHEALPEGLTLTATSGSVTDYVSYIESGALRQAGGAIQSGAFTLSRQGNSRTISLIGTGRVTLQ